MKGLDLLIESAAVSGQLAAGVDPGRLAVRTPLGSRGVAVLAGGVGRVKRAKSAPWTQEEDAFLKACLGSFSDEEIGEILGRTAQAVHVHRERDLGLPTRSKHPDVMSTEQVAQGLCKDGKSIHLLFDRGILPGWMLPGSPMRFRLVSKTQLLMFLTNPMNWCYFDPERIDSKTNRRISQVYDQAFWDRARRLVRKRMKLWNDEWWPIGRVAEYYGTSSNVINHYIHSGRLKATDWGNWRLLKSHATDPALKLVQFHGKGCKGIDRSNITEAAKAFILLGHAVGLMYKEIAQLMMFKEKQVYYQLRRMRREGKIPDLIKRYGLKIIHDPDTGSIAASWRVYAHRFPVFAKKMESGGRTQAERKQVSIARKRADLWSVYIRRKFGVTAREGEIMSDRVNRLVCTSVEDCKSSLRFESSRKVLNQALKLARKRGKKTMARNIEARIRQLDRAGKENKRG